jgi:hypothetical protein
MEQQFCKTFGQLNIFLTFGLGKVLVYWFAFW